MSGAEPASTATEGTAVDTTTTTLDPREAVLSELDQLRQRQAADRAARLTKIRHARTLGLTNQAIGDALGVTEVAVRNMIKRAESGTSRTGDE